MDLTALDYPLDPGQIAQRPLPARDGARLLVLDRACGARTHTQVEALPAELRAGDLLVVNDAEVSPARLCGRRATGGAIDVLLTEPVGAAGDRWQCLARKIGRLRPSERIAFGPDLEGRWCGRTTGPFGEIELRADGDLAAALQRHGALPLPPYIRRPHGPLPEDQERYQTIFARRPGAVAAPTAGLHFTHQLLAAVAERGVAHASLTLMVGAGTFLAVRGTDLGAHAVPPERYEVPATTADAVRAARRRGGRVVAVGTTTARALESAADGRGGVHAGGGRTDLVIAPGHRFRAVDALFTNFHLPGSTLLALVAAFAGVEPTVAAYREASAAGYRFYSYGDAMLVR